MSNIYKHTKSGNLYLLLYKAKETNNAQTVIVYQALYGSNDIWVRPAEEFYSFIETNEGLKPRFENIVIERL